MDDEWTINGDFIVISWSFFPIDFSHEKLFSPNFPYFPLIFPSIFPMKNWRLPSRAHGQAHHGRLQGAAAQRSHRGGGQDLGADDAIDL